MRLAHTRWGCGNTLQSGLAEWLLSRLLEIEWLFSGHEGSAIRVATCRIRLEWVVMLTRAFCFIQLLVCTGMAFFCGDLISSIALRMSYTVCVWNPADWLKVMFYFTVCLAQLAILIMFLLRRLVGTTWGIEVLYVLWFWCVKNKFCLFLYMI